MEFETVKEIDRKHSKVNFETHQPYVQTSPQQVPKPNPPDVYPSDNVITSFQRVLLIKSISKHSGEANCKMI